MAKHRVEHRAEKLYEKLLSQSGGRWMNRVAREQRIKALLDKKKMKREEIDKIHGRS